jgi:hypothetical protein
VSALVLLLRCGATAAALAFVFGVWTRRPALVWGAWMVELVHAEALGFALGGTYSGLVWWLRAHPALGSVLGALIIAIAVWFGVWHGWIERDLFPRLRRTYLDDGILAVLVLLASILTAALARRRQA